MANRNFTPVNFALEKNMVHLFAKITFGATGIPSLDTNNSKGICAVHPDTVVFTGSVTNSVTSIGTVSSFAGLYTGMTVAGTGMAASNTIGSITTALGVSMLKQNITTGDVSLFASGGRYRFQFGSREGVNLDAYNKLLQVSAEFSETAASASGTAVNVALAPNAADWFVVENKTNIRTTTRSATCASTDCSLVLQFGEGRGIYFNALNPVAGEAIKFHFVFGNSTAI